MTQNMDGFRDAAQQELVPGSISVASISPEELMAAGIRQVILAAEYKLREHKLIPSTLDMVDSPPPTRRISLYSRQRIIVDPLPERPKLDQSLVICDPHDASIIGISTRHIADPASPTLLSVRDMTPFHMPGNEYTPRPGIVIDCMRRVIVQSTISRWHGDVTPSDAPRSAQRMLDWASAIGRGQRLEPDTVKEFQQPHKNLTQEDIRSITGIPEPDAPYYIL